MNALAAVPPSALATASLDYPAFKTAMLNACKVIERKSTPPVLGAVLIRAVRGGVQVIGTDLDVYTTTSVPGEVAPDFVALVDAHRLRSTMEKVKDAATINFALDGGRLTAAIGKLNLTLAQEHKEEDFPAEQKFRTALGDANSSFIVPSAKLATILQRVSFAISTEETRYYLNGVYMHVNVYRERLTFVACDGHRLARYEAPIPTGADAMPDSGVIIPRKTVLELLRLVSRKGCPADVMVTVTPTGISFLIGEDELLESKVIEGTFPDYGRVCPELNPLKVGIPTAGLIDAIRQVSSVLTERSRGVRLMFSPGRLQLRCTSDDFGAASTDISITSTFELEIGFNAAYLMNILGQLEGGAMLELADPGAPIMIRDGADDGVSYTQMPMRV